MSVTGLTPAELERLRGASQARRAEALAVYVGEPAADRPAILGTRAVDAAGLHFLPRFPLVPGVRYTARFAPGDGTRRDHVFEVGAPAGIRPAVVGVFPTGDALPENALRVYVHFSQPMEMRDAHRRVRLLEDTGAEVPLAFVEIEHGLWDPDQKRLTLLFHPGRVKRGIAPGERLGPPLRAGRSYRLVVDGAIADAAGRTLDASFERSFMASPADRASPRAEDLRARPPDEPTAPLVLELPEPLDEALLRRLVWVEDRDGRRVEGRVEVSAGETRWTLRPERPWAPGDYAVLLHPAVEDRAGNRFDRLFDHDAGTLDAAPAVPIRLPFRVERLSAQGAIQ